ncbi:DUF2141 domain-containing protein [Siccationidurans ginsengisoli]|uniref:DUF2141 domain-containing protein n=1 Tax=Hymenobacter TaxID=89966 RepID=UPI001AAC57D4|nr:MULTISPECIES: DUF2141 domain-containing protein [unclassified Hymenobacter]MBO2031964.1 DUF2141 domain-containing protein [Hymenobacter sp. BT559]
MTALPLAALLLSGLTLGTAPVPATQTVTVVIGALASNHSEVKLNFYNAADKFLQKDQQAFRMVVKPEGKTEISVPVELAPGDWAVALTQDTNDNGKLDKNMLGIPTEPYAFSNNVRPRLAAPKFDECKFTVNGPGKVVSITTWN